jgi:hypothetical protein
MIKKIILLTIGLLFIGVTVYAAGNLIVKGVLNLDGNVGGSVNLSNPNDETLTIENLNGGVILKMRNAQFSHPRVFEMKQDQVSGGHFSVIPGGVFSYWLFEDTTPGFDPSFKVCGYPSEALSNQCVSLKIEGTNNDLNMTTEGPNSDILLMPQENIGIGETNPTEKLYVNGNIYATGNVTWGSSRELKEGIKDLTEDEAISALDNLHPKKYYYKADKKDEHIGFIAEEVPELLATKDRKSLDPMDFVAVLTKVVKEQQNIITELKLQNTLISKKLIELEKEVKLKGSFTKIVTD